ncbi:MAG: hypothetical protein ACRCY4_06730 [Brevinema sp.]
MKSFLLIVLLCFGLSPIFAAPTDTYLLEFEDERTGLAYERRFLFGFDLRMGGLLAAGPASPIFATGITALNLSFTFPLIDNISLQLQLRFGFPFFTVEGSLANTLPPLLQSSITAGAFVGVGGRLADWRDYGSGKGWSVWMHGGVILDYGLQNFFIQNTRPFTSSESVYVFFTIGGEANAQAVYNFSERLALSFGVYADFRVAPFAGDPFYIAYERLVATFVMIGFGFSVGMLF